VGIVALGFIIFHLSGVEEWRFRDCGLALGLVIGERSGFKGFGVRIENIHPLDGAGFGVYGGEVVAIVC